MARNWGMLAKVDTIGNGRSRKGAKNSFKPNV